jgi:hypothetical protein
MKMFCMVKSRAQSIGLDSLSLVPLVDSLSFGNNMISHQMINTNYHLQGSTNKDYYTTEKFMFDYEQLFGDGSMSND